MIRLRRVMPPPSRRSAARVASALAAAVAIVLLAGALAHTWMLLGTDTARPGQIAVLVSGSGTFSAVDISERLDGADVPVGSVAPPATTDPDGQV